NFDFIDDGKAYNVNIWIFPNPVKRLLNIYLESQAVIKLTYSLHDVTGRLVKYGKLNSTANAIHLGDCQPGTYCLSIVSAAGVRVKSFKIVKM
ncbi:MAG TPA: T9SS type A sorting domain-containing protein, partial [Bacteroidales bacterium]|nr:T9SS type A sorting domain-containing protein [Bacteroidales bacterium]